MHKIRTEVMSNVATKKSEIDYKSAKKIYVQVLMKIRKDSGIPDALDCATAISGISAQQYIRQALLEKLIRDGYDVVPSTNEEPED